ncbi:enoyl-CoA hydratase/isomerase family protein [Mycobacterium intracellulare]|nr:enoyl-CoA hydratase-related protein [Mycobacterium intracellulare]ASW94740.1 enoyl-CoA hydratase [Mycobacterium intracellulare]MCA2231671.1 enoyl-CoA hydratase/isomerase family protein [Mycobacterium intracellulare]MDM3896754.1 enoyl-CoA hydratase-related protein [Mycobacterium intracellulare]PBA21618.1 enoyl-CoA hydratase [Mycobacterium intracellulare]PBA32631.1 enoyl-CoA hydratase [Mycobacterium intracellulare]
MSQGAGSAGAEGSVTVHRDGAVLRVTLDRPSRRNSLTQLMIGTLVESLTAAASDDSLRAVHLRGAGDDFCAGSDWVAANDPGGQRPRTGDLVRRVPHAAHRVIELVAGIQLPVVCSVRGWAVGFGCNLALAADFTVAADDAVFWEPFLDRGFSPDSGSTWLVPRLVGLARARRMLLLGEKVSGDDAADWGLIHQSVSGPDLDRAAEELVARLASGPTAAIGLAKQAMNFGQHATLGQSLNQELFNLELSCRTGDFKEGLEAFRRRRDPDFRGR